MTSRGNSACIYIKITQELSAEECENIKKQVVTILNTNRTADSIIEHCEKKYTSLFVPAKNRFDISIRYNDNVLYWEHLDID